MAAIGYGPIGDYITAKVFSEKYGCYWVCLLLGITSQQKCSQKKYGYGPIGDYITAKVFSEKCGPYIYWHQRCSQKRLYSYIHQKCSQENVESAGGVSHICLNIFSEKYSSG